MTSSFDVVIVGAGIAGSVFAHAFARETMKTRSAPLRVALLERSLAEPDRIVGELLQPGGVAALESMEMEDCLEGIGAVPVKGYCVVSADRQVHIPYPGGREGRSFHHGRFIMALREKAKNAPGVEVIEATVTDLVECTHTGRVLGVEATQKIQAEEDEEPQQIKHTYLADLVVIADGCFSNFRNRVLKMEGANNKSLTRSHFVGAILKDVRLPIDKHGTVALVKNSGPVLLYQIDEHDTRILIDVKQPVPADLQTYISTNITPQLPATLQLPIKQALEKDRLRRMPNSFFPSKEQGGTQSREGVVLLGDAWNMRHPLTGGGMTVAFNDVVILSELLAAVSNLHDWEDVTEVLHRWHWARKPLSSTVNILSVALYDLFGAEDENLEVLRQGCFKYFELGGQCIEGPASLLSGIIQSPSLLFRHFFTVAFYSIWVMFTHPRLVPSYYPDEKPVYVAPRIEEYPGLVLKSFSVFWTACVVFLPLMWTEIRWW